MKSFKVLHIGKYYPPVPGGIENFLKDLINCQIKKDIRVRAIVHDDRFYEKNNHKNSSDPNIIKKVKTYGKFIYAPISPLFRWEIKKNLLEFKPNIIHIHMPNTSVFWLLSIKEAEKIPWIVHWHADVLFSSINPLLSLAYNFYKPLERQILTNASKIIVTSPPYLKTSLTLKPFWDKCVVIPLGLDTQRFEKPDEQSLIWANNQWGKEKKRILSVGRLAYYKGYQNLINAMKYVNNMRLIIVGEGEKKDYLSNLILKNNLEEFVSITGYINNEKLAALFSTTHVFCLPSIERTEAFGLVLLEALLHKKPIIASDVEGSGMSWILEKTGAGYKFRYDSISSIVMALQDIFDDTLENTKIINENIKKGIPYEFTIESVCERITVLYNDVTH